MQHGRSTPTRLGVLGCQPENPDLRQPVSTCGTPSRFHSLVVRRTPSKPPTEKDRWDNNTMAEPSDSELQGLIREMVPRVDLETTGIKDFIKLLQKELGGIELKPRKKFIKETIANVLEDLEDGQSEEEDDDEHDDDDDEIDLKPSKKKRSGGGGLAQKKEISDKLANLIGKGKEMARTDVVKSLWEYIREHNLQNPEKRSEILLDAAMKDVFGCDRFTMFSMNKYIGAHIHPFKPVDLTTSTTPKKRAKKGPPSAKKRKSGSQPAYYLSPELTAVVGADVLPRPQVVSKIWDYIRSNQLQNPDNKREIICDTRLQAVMKREKVTMFNMNKFLSSHILEKAEPGRYKHEESEG